MLSLHVANVEMVELYNYSKSLTTIILKECLELGIEAENGMMTYVYKVNNDRTIQIKDKEGIVSFYVPMSRTRLRLEIKTNGECILDEKIYNVIIIWN